MPWGTRASRGWFSDLHGSLASNRLSDVIAPPMRLTPVSTAKGHVLYVDGPVTRGHGAGGTWAAHCPSCLEMSPGRLCCLRCLWAALGLSRVQVFGC